MSDDKKTSKIEELGVNERVLLHIKYKHEPYCIVRVLQVDDRFDQDRTKIWLSIMKTGFELSKGTYVNPPLMLLDETIDIQFLHTKQGKAAIRFEAPDNVIFKRLSKRNQRWYWDQGITR